MQYLCVGFECQSLAGASFCRSLWTLLDCVLHESAFHWHSLKKKSYSFVLQCLLYSNLENKKKPLYAKKAIVCNILSLCPQDVYSVSYSLPGQKSGQTVRSKVPPVILCNPATLLYHCSYNGAIVVLIWLTEAQRCSVLSAHAHFFKCNLPINVTFNMWNKISLSALLHQLKLTAVHLVIPAQQLW